MRRLSNFAVLLLIFVALALLLHDARMIKMVFGQELDASFLKNEAGITAYVNLNQTLDLSVVRSVFKIVEKETSAYIVGSISLPNLSESDDPHIFIHNMGWIFAYYLKEEPVSKIINWNNLSMTKLDKALEIICETFNFTSFNAQYFDFRYPYAEKLAILIDDDEFKINIPNSITVYEISYSVNLQGHYEWYYGIRNDIYGYFFVDGETVLSGFSGIKIGFLNPNQLKQNLTHNVNYQSASGAIIIEYKNDPNDADSRIKLEYVDTLYSIILESPPQEIFKKDEGNQINPQTIQQQPSLYKENRGEPLQSPPLSSYEYDVQMPNGETLTINISTTSEIVKDLNLDFNNSKISLQVNEQRNFASYYEMGFLMMRVPRELFEAFQSSIDKLLVTVDGEEVIPSYAKSQGNEFLFRIEYGYGIHEIDIYYLTFSLTVRVKTLFGLPIARASVVIEWPNGEIFKTAETSSSGVAIFRNVPPLSSPYTVMVKYGLLSFQFIPEEVEIKKDTDIYFVTYLYYDILIFIFTLSLITGALYKLHKHQRSAGNSKNESADQKIGESEGYV
jgi:hypothetical protein